MNARKKEIAALPDHKIATILTTETLAGINSKGNPRVMFSPKRHKGATGIIAVVKWARGDTEPEPELAGCDADGQATRLRLRVDQHPHPDRCGDAAWRFQALGLRQGPLDVWT